MSKIGGHTKLTWYGHGSWVIDTPGGKRIMIDPWTEGNPACPEELKRVDRLDAVLITHGHFDHIPDIMQVYRDAKPETVLAIYEVCVWLGKKGINSTDMNKGGTFDLGDVKVTMLHAEHSSTIQEEDGSLVPGGEAVSYLLEMENGFRIWHSGDTAIFGDMRLYGELFSPDLAILSIGDHYTMDPYQAAYACELLGVSKVVPSHHSTFPLLKGSPDALRQALAKRGYKCEVLDVEPGETID